MVRFEILHVQGMLRAVMSGSHPEEFAERVRFQRAKSVHGAMDHDRRRPAAMRSQHALDVFRVSVIGETFIVDHDIEAFGPIRVLINALLNILAPGAIAPFLHERPLHVGAGANTLGKN